MQFSLNKCAKITFSNGSQVKCKNIILIINTEIIVLRITNLEHY